MVECYFSVEKKDIVEIILITFKGIKCDNAKNTIIAIKERMSILYMKYELNLYFKIEDKSCSDFECSLALKKLTVYLERYYGKKNNNID